MKKVFLSAVVCFLFAALQPLFAQNGVKIAATAGTADQYAMLDVTSTSKGVLIPRMTQAQRDAIATTPTTGLLIFQTDNTPGFYYYNGSA